MTTHLETALMAQRWIDTLQRLTDHGIAWSHSTERPQVVSHTLYNGSAGITALLSRTARRHRATSGFSRSRVAAADDLAAYARRDAMAVVRDLHRLAGAGICARRGRAGRTGEAAPRDRCRALSRPSARKRASRSAPASAGSNRCRSPTFTASKAIARSTMHRSARRAPALCCCMPRAPDLHPNALQWATEVGDRLLEVAQPHRSRAELGADVGHAVPVESGELRARRRRRWRVHGHVVRGDRSPTVSRCRERRGGASDAHRAPGGRRSPRASPRRRRREPVLPLGVPRTAGHDAPVPSAASDHRRSMYSQWNDGALRGLLSTGAPETRSDGFWNNVSQCCGDAGVGDYALHSYRATRRCTLSRSRAT